MYTIVPKKPSKRVENFSQISYEAEEMQYFLEKGKHAPGRAEIKTAFALHHSQVNPEPFNFFVLKQSLVGARNTDVCVIVNPEITWKNLQKKKIISREGCMSFPFRHDKDVSRYSEIKVRYQVPNVSGGLIEREEILTGFMALVFQHEIQHAHGQHIYL